MKIWLLSRKEDFECYEHKRFAEVAKKEKISLDIVAPEDFEILVTQEGKKSIVHKGHQIEFPDCVIPRHGSYTNYFTLAVLRQLEKLGVFVLNPSRGITKSKDKLETMQILAANKIPIPKTMLAKFPVDYQIIKQELGYPLILKTISGEEGKGVFLANDEQQLRDLLGIFEKSKHRTAYLILQEFMADSKGRDLRVMIIGGKIVGAMLRTAREGTFKANFSEGGSAQKYDLDKAAIRIALESAQVTNLNIVGVDILFDKESYKICELNSAPGFKGFEKATGLNIPKMTYDYIKKELERRKKTPIENLIDKVTSSS
ncbi:RimK family alpha-L-glutamate ligase [Candidatus Micrarchaeota archaeon]|nr:RimK family alpha-L-glutamate ligase [Candidatus Micrarchaeota archaeon]MBU1165431.1 RimK family alpha-L-glutamate ligase [Candidatus Micrarchaeota archaeon]MBU1887215.1 RimK family alpha-L-glutamate ligase [Candidatus Micrarchaeota archaeon]